MSDELLPTGEDEENGFDLGMAREINAEPEFSEVDLREPYHSVTVFDFGSSESVAYVRYQEPDRVNIEVIGAGGDGRISQGLTMRLRELAEDGVPAWDAFIELARANWHLGSVDKVRPGQR